MKHKFILATGLIFLLTGVLSGCAGQTSAVLVNTLTYDAADFQSLRFDYDADDIYVLKSDNDKIVVKEYMNEDQKKYYARTNAQDGELLITEGERPRGSGFKAYLEIYIPVDYKSNLSLHSTTGTINSAVALNLSGIFSVDTTSGIIEVSNTKTAKIKAISTNGTLKFENIEAGEISVQATNATTVMDQISGTINYQSKEGGLTATGISGSGSFHASGNGVIDLSFTNVKSDISVYSKNGTLTITLPSDLDFKFSALTREGTIDSSFADDLTITDNTAIGDVGASPDITVELETRNGDIKVER